MFLSGWLKGMGGVGFTDTLVASPLSLTLCAAAFIGLMPVSSKLAASEVNCPVVWDGYIEQIRQMIAPLGDNFPLLFVDRRGHVFDCLNLWSNPQLIKKIEVIETFLPIDREMPIPSDPSQWPVNVCTNGSGSWGDRMYFKVMLPSEVEILGSKSCQNRVFKGIERMVTKEKINGTR